MKSGFISVLILLLLFALVGSVAFVSIRNIPKNQVLKDTTLSLPHYPDSQNETVATQSSVFPDTPEDFSLHFSSQTDPESVYKFYDSFLTQNAWSVYRTYESDYPNSHNKTFGYKKSIKGNEYLIIFELTASKDPHNVNSYSLLVKTFYPEF